MIPDSISLIALLDPINSLSTFYDTRFEFYDRFNFHTVPSGKMFTYLASGVPVICNNLPGLRVVEEFGAGVLIEDLDAGSIRSAIQKIEDFRAKLQLQTLADRGVLQHRKIPRGKSRSRERVASRVALEAACANLLRSKSQQSFGRKIKPEACLGPIPRDRLITGLLWTLCIRKRILCGMTLSARNRLEGEIVELHLGGVMAHVVMRVGENLIESVITKRSADEMQLKVGDKVSAVIKSTEVMLEKD